LGACLREVLLVVGSSGGGKGEGGIWFEAWGCLYIVTMGKGGGMCKDSRLWGVGRGVSGIGSDVSSMTSGVSAHKQRPRTEG
jgi:hypothetical protein